MHQNAGGKVGTLNKADVLIVGGGATGLALALALRKLSCGGLDVMLCDPALGSKTQGPRSTALAQGPWNMLDALGIASGLACLAQPISRMEIGEWRPGDPLGANLTFGGSVGGRPVGYMVFLRDLEAALHKACAEAGVRMVCEPVLSLTIHESSAFATLRDSAWRSRLVVGADGGKSVVATTFDSAPREWSYDRRALVVTISHEHDHDGVATQYFMEDGPLAVLPMTGRRSSIVWTARPETCSRLAGAPEALLDTLRESLAPRLGQIVIDEQPATFPLGFRMASRFAAHRVALAGDAAHRVHPLAGQGLNLGLRDVAVLAEVVVDQAVDGLDFGSADTLRRYDEHRRFDVLSSGLAFDLLHRVFGARSAPAGALRRLGLQITDRTSALKRLLEAEASGVTGASPRLFR